MEQAGLPFEKIVFVCVHEREPGQGVCCSARGSLEIQAALKERVKALGLARKIRVSRSGCMDRCAKGVNIMVFPDNTWFSGVTMDDVDAVLEAVTQGVTPA